MFSFSLSLLHELHPEDFIFITHQLNRACNNVVTYNKLPLYKEEAHTHPSQQHRDPSLSILGQSHLDNCVAGHSMFAKIQNRDQVRLSMIQIDDGLGD